MTEPTDAPVEPNLVTLDEPIQRGDQTIAFIEMRPGTFGQYHGCSLKDLLTIDTDAVIAVAPRLSTPFVTEADLAIMGPADLFAFGSAIALAFADGAEEMDGKPLGKVRLKNAIARAGEAAIGTLTLRRPMAPELRGLNMVELVTMKVDAIIQLVPRIAMPLVTREEIAGLAPADGLKLAIEVANFFLGKGAMAGGAPSRIQ